MVNLGFSIGDLHFKNPVLTASGTFGYGSEFDDFLDVSRLGGNNCKRNYPRTQGRKSISQDGRNTIRDAQCSRTCRTRVLITLKTNIYPRISAYNTNVIVNINGSYIDDYVALAERINKLEKIPAIELNISCPNVRMGGMAFGTNLDSAREVTKAVRKVYSKKLIVKLSPNVTNIVDFALMQ
ncbi:MAG: hypothetical protein MZV63_21695 [Marinilabiliales bacterium]|nr:hypothetical protein [Marinilabiliales bacterium]